MFFIDIDSVFFSLIIHRNVYYQLKYVLIVFKFSFKCRTRVSGLMHGCLFDELNLFCI